MKKPEDWELGANLILKNYERSFFNGLTTCSEIVKSFKFLAIPEACAVLLLIN